MTYVNFNRKAYIRVASDIKEKWLIDKIGDYMNTKSSIAPDNFRDAKSPMWYFLDCDLFLVNLISSFTHVNDSWASANIVFYLTQARATRASLSFCVFFYY